MDLSLVRGFYVQYEDDIRTRENYYRFFKLNVQLLSSISGIVVFVGRCHGNRAENTVNTLGVSQL